MAANKSHDYVQSDVFECLKITRYSATSLQPLAGGSVNFIFKAHLAVPLEDGTESVLVKHGEAYMRVAPQNKIPLARCRVENECLKTLADVCINSPSGFDGQNLESRTPKPYMYDDGKHTQVQEFLEDSIDLKTQLLRSGSLEGESIDMHYHQLGKALAVYITEFHRTAKHQPELLEVLSSNSEMQTLKSMINYDWMLNRVDQSPAILSEAKEVFLKVKEEATRELEDKKNLTAIHGDYWPGNILQGDRKTRTALPIFIVDWENAQLGVPAGDHGEMLGELLLYSLFKESNEMVWMIRGYADGLGEQPESYKWRTALQAGIHLLAFGTLERGLGPKEVLGNVAKFGRDIVLKAWKRDLHWFEESDLACLFGPAEFVAKAQ